MTVAPWTQVLVEILQLTAAGPLLAVRPSGHHDHFRQVCLDTNRAIRETFVYMRSGTTG